MKGCPASTSGSFAAPGAAPTPSARLGGGQCRPGRTGFTTVSQAGAALLSARNGAAQARADAAASLVQLYVALGGGWDADVPEVPQGAPKP